MLRSQTTSPVVKEFLDHDSNTFSYVVIDPVSNNCAIIDSVMDFDYPSGSTNFKLANRIIQFVEEQQLSVEWLIETHVHADHLSAAPYIQEKLGGRLAIGEHIITVQETFGKIFNEGTEFERDGSQFDHLFKHREIYNIGQLQCQAIHTPGHTPACMTHLIGEAAFVGDTLFMPDAGTARCDFPGGSADTLYESIQQILSLPDSTRVFLCHDYAPGGRELKFETTVGEQRQANIHVGKTKTKEAFVELRQARDATLGMPKLILPALQVNMRAGHLPEPETNGMRYFRIPINYFNSGSSDKE